MYKYEDTHTNVSGTFPNAVAVNVSVPGAGDGTEFIAAGVNDAWGARQALMDYAGLTPNSVTEAPGASQMIEAMRRSFSAPGEIVLWHGQADPATLGLRLLILQGQGVLINDYTLLDAACYIGDGNNPDTDYKGYYHAQDAAGTIRDTAGPYLILPECRGTVIRGWDPTGIYDQYGTVRKYPDRQLHALQTHIHEIQTATTSLYAKFKDMDIHGGGDDGLELLAGATGDRLLTSTIQASANQGTETRMTNYQAKICVRY